MEGAGGAAAAIPVPENSIVLRNTNIRSAPEFLTALGHLHNLKVLDLEGNRLGPANIDLVAKAIYKPGEGLRGMRELEVLNLSGNDMGIEGVRALGAAFPFIENLTTLHLENNSLDISAVRELAAALSFYRHSSVLHIIKIKTGNDISDEAEKIINAAVPTDCRIL